MSLERRLSALKGHAATDDDPAEIPALRVHDDGAAGPCRCVECLAEWQRAGHGRPVTLGKRREPQSFGPAGRATTRMTAGSRSIAARITAI